MAPGQPFNGPLIVFGMVRSGTSLTRELVNSLDGVCLLYESPAFLELTAGRVDAAAAERIRAALVATAPAGGVWGNKTVQLAELGLIDGLFPRARFVFIVRDPRAVAASYRRFFGGAPLVAALDWRAHVAAIEQLSAVLGDRALTLRFEDVVDHPGDTLERLSCLVGRGVVDAGIVERIDPGRARGWAPELSPAVTRRVEGVCFAGMRRWGYDPHHADGPSEPGLAPRLAALGRHAVGRQTRHRRPLSRLAARVTVRRYLGLLRARTEG